MIKIEHLRFLANFANISKEEAFEKTVELAFKNLLGEAKDIDQMTDDEIRAAVNDYYTRFDPRLNRYRRGLETCPQAKTSKCGRAIFFSFFRRVRATSMTQRRVENTRVYF